MRWGGRNEVGLALLGAEHQGVPLGLVVEPELFERHALEWGQVGQVGHLGVLENEFRSTTVERRYGALVFCPSPVTGTRLPTQPALTMAWIWPWLSARLYTAGSSIRPWKPRRSAQPMVSGRAFGTMGPSAAWDATICPLT